MGQVDKKGSRGKEGKRKEREKDGHYTLPWRRHFLFIQLAMDTYHNL